MPRLVYLERREPYKVEPEDGRPIYVCGCGLSRNKPFCDGSHVRTKDEDAATTYMYDDRGRVRLTP